MGQVKGHVHTGQGQRALLYGASSQEAGLEGEEGRTSMSFIK